jgi:hypothetical protein
MYQAAANHIRNGERVLSKIVPAVTLACRPPPAARTPDTSTGRQRCATPRPRPGTSGRRTRSATAGRPGSPGTPDPSRTTPGARAPSADSRPQPPDARPPHQATAELDLSRYPVAFIDVDHGGLLARQTQPQRGQHVCGLLTQGLGVFPPARHHDDKIVGITDPSVDRLTVSAAPRTIDPGRAGRFPDPGEVLIEHLQCDVGQQRGEAPWV